MTLAGRASLDRARCRTHRPAVHAGSGEQEPVTSDPAKPAGAEGWDHVIAHAGISAQRAREIACLAHANGTSFHAEILVAADIDQERYFRAIAAALGLAFCEEVDPERLVLRNRDLIAAIAEPRGPKIVQYAAPDARNIVLVSPAHFDMGQMASYLSRYPELAGRMMIVAPAILRRALLSRAGPLLAGRARRHLAEHRPACSASIVSSGRQGLVIGLALAVLIAGLSWAPVVTLAGLHGLALAFFISCTALRLLAAARAGRKQSCLPRDTETRRLPVYSILVPLFDEADIISQLIPALDKLDWPRSKLEIKLICESRDRSTLKAIETMRLPPNFEVLVVPDMAPRTKPKALAFALQTVSGELVAVYDAEDLPHPLQLKEAWHAFREGGEDLACVQAPLCIINGGTNRLTAMFSLEYAALFRGLLPALAAWCGFLPLGGTSNHFRTSVLKRVGGWDPFNVTEDADVAFRMCRAGYRIGTISLPTFEDAPDDTAIWMRQRSRWFKGWMQTLLVHWRKPAELMAQMRPGTLIVAHILLPGMCLSALAYIFAPAYFGMVLIQFDQVASMAVGLKILLAVDAGTFGLAHFAFLFLGWRVLSPAERRGFWKAVIRLPWYWTLLSAAAWSALFEIVRAPFHWAKTPHRQSSRCDLAAFARQNGFNPAEPCTTVRDRS